MAADLKSHFDRLHWAGDEIARLGQEIEQYLASKPVEVRFHYHLGTGRRIYQAYEEMSPPIGIQIRTGTIINELRAILDALAVTLAIRNGATKLDDTYFPTAKSANGFADKRVQGKMRRLSPADQAIIASLKPYPQGNDLLFTLHSADIIRKHQRLVLSASHSRGITLGAGIYDGEKITKIEYRSGPISKHPFRAELASDYHIEFAIPCYIAFSEPAFIEGKDVLTTLRDFQGLVDSILKLFD